MRKSIVGTAGLVLFMAATSNPALAQPAPQPLLARCPLQVSLTTAGTEPGSGFGGASTHTANFQAAETQFAGGANVPNRQVMVCHYAVGGHRVGRLQRNVPPGLRCTVNAAVPRQFDCLPGQVPGNVNRVPRGAVTN